VLIFQKNKNGRINWHIAWNFDFVLALFFIKRAILKEWDIFL
jgi:hypothetical protein